MISKSNYEVYFIDYFDGKLDRNQVKELFVFLGQHPELKDEFESFSGSMIEADEQITFEGKDRLKKETITQYNYKTWLIGYVEKDLNKEQVKEVDQFLSKHPELKTELNLFRSTKLVADAGIIFDKKNTLRKGKVIVLTPALKRVISVAAIFIFILLGYFMLQRVNDPTKVISDKSLPQQERLKKIDENLNDDSRERKLAEKENPVKKIENNSDRKIANNKKAIEKRIPVNDPVITEEFKEEQTLAFSADTVQDNIQEVEKDTINANPVSTEEQYASVNQKNRTLSRKQISEIFSDEDLNELGIDKKEVLGEDQSKSLVDLASSELDKFSKSKNIQFGKKKDVNDNSVTYALGVRNFSISHTKAQ